MAQVTVKQGFQGQVDWETGHVDSFDWVSPSAQRFLGIERENPQAEATHVIGVDSEDAPRLSVAGDTLIYD